SEGYAIIEFESGQAGHPFFDLVPAVTKIRLNGQDLSGSGITTVSDPDNATKFLVLNETVEASVVNVLEVWFNPSYLRISNGAVRYNFSMSDLSSSGRAFWEQYAPSNFEFDQFRQSLHLTLHDTA